MPFGHHDHVVLSCPFHRTFRKNENEAPWKRGSERRRTSTTRKKGKRAAEVGDKKKRIPRNFASYARWHLQTTIRAYSRNVRHHRRSYPIRLESRRNSNLRTDCPGCVFRTYEKWVWPALPLSPPLLSATPPSFSPEAGSFSKPTLRHPAQEFIAGRVEELKRLRTVRRDTSSFNYVIFNFWSGNLALKYNGNVNFNAAVILQIGTKSYALLVLQNFYCLNNRKERIFANNKELCENYFCETFNEIIVNIIIAVLNLITRYNSF